MSTWKLVFLHFITLGIYFSFYSRRQSRLLNSRLDDESQIPRWFINICFVWPFLDLLVIGGLFAFLDQDEKAFTVLSNMGQIAYALVSCGWAYVSCVALNFILGVTKGERLWSQKWFVVLFSYFYFNYRVNVANGMLDKKEV